MPKYDVEVEQYYRYKMRLEAPTEAEAKSKALKYYEAGFDIGDWEWYDADNVIRSITEAPPDAVCDDFSTEEEWIAENKENKQHSYDSSL